MTCLSSWRWPRPSARTLAILVPMSVVLGLWQGTAVLLAMRNDGDPTPWTEPFLWELTGALAGLVCSYIPITATSNAPSPRARWFFVLHGWAYLLFSSSKFVLMISSRYVIYWIMGWGHYQYSYWPGHLAMEAMKDLISYAIMVTAYSLYLSSKQRQAEALRAAELAAELKESRLEALLAQLNPHFLMNALNTVSSVMYEDVARTDRLISDLGQVLRAGFESDRPTWSLAEEREHTERFVSILQARFGDRLRVEWDIPNEALRAAVPRFAFQLLVENAVKHNQDQRQDLALRIRARALDSRVELEVEDTGRGFGSPSPARGAGLGLRHLEEILRLLHGGEAGLAREAGPEGGARVRLSFPAT